MLSNKTGVKLPGAKTENQGKLASNRGDRKVGVNSPIGNANKSFASTAYTQGQRNQQTLQKSDFVDGNERYGNERYGNERYGDGRNYASNQNQYRN